MDAYLGLGAPAPEADVGGGAHGRIALDVDRPED